MVGQELPPPTEDQLFDWNQTNASLSKVLYPEDETLGDRNPDELLIQESIAKIRS